MNHSGYIMHLYEMKLKVIKIGFMIARDSLLRDNIYGVL